MTNQFANSFSTAKDNVAAALVLAAVAIAIIASAFHGTTAVATEPAPVVKMDTIVITAKRIHTVKLDTIVITASRNLNVA
jgi:hypothetical protein